MAPRSHSVSENREDTTMTKPIYARRVPGGRVTHLIKTQEQAFCGTPFGSDGSFWAFWGPRENRTVAPQRTCAKCVCARALKDARR